MNLLLPADLEIINRRLKDKYGYTENFQNFRLVWSEDLLEKRLCRQTEEGFDLIIPQMREVKKYAQYIHEKYVLEGLTVVPFVQEKQLTTKLSYEPIWVFEKNDEYVRPTWPAVDFVLQRLKEQTERTSYPKYKDPEANPEESAEARKKELDATMETLFGNESDLADALAYKEGIVVPGGYKNAAN